MSSSLSKNAPIRARSRLLAQAFLAGAVLLVSQAALAQASAVRSPTAVRLMPAIPTASDVQAAVNSSVGSGVPAGFTERRVGYSAGRITAENASLATTYAGWPKQSCTIDTLSSVCTDGRAPSTITQDACAGAYASVIYEVVTSSTTCTPVSEGGGGQCTTTVSDSGFYTCAAPVTYVSYLVKDTSAGGSVSGYPLTSSQIAAYRFGMDAVMSESATRNAVCQGYGYRSAFNWSEGQFNSCRDNRTSRFLNGAWVAEPACSGPHLVTLSCAR